MEEKIMEGVSPANVEYYLEALRDNNLDVYIKELPNYGLIGASEANPVDVYLVYDADEELNLARKVIADLEDPGMAAGDLDAGSGPSDLPR